MLRGAALQAGHEVDVVDLAIDEVNILCDRSTLARPTGLLGDHNKNAAALKALEEQGWTAADEADLPENAPWTDDYVNVLAPLWAGIRSD